MKIDHLLSFRKVAKTGSFTRAAQALFITQPTVTHHIQSLEYELGCKLLIRSNQDTKLTPEGEELAAKVDDLFRQIEEIKGIASRKKIVCGELKLAASSVMGTYFLPPILKTVSGIYPDIGIHLRFGNAYAIATWVQDGFVDIGFAPWVPGFATLNFIKANEEPCILVASPEYYAVHGEAIAKGDFSGIQFIIREKGTKVHEVASGWLKRLPLRSERKPVVMGDMESIKNMVRCDGGVAVIPRCCVEQNLGEGLMKEIAPPEGLPMSAVEYFIIQRKNEKTDPLVSLLLSVQAEQYRAAARRKEKADRGQA